MIDPNAQAFPTTTMDDKGRIGYAPGLTIRAHFAAMAMQSILAVDLRKMAEHHEDYISRDNPDEGADPCLPTYDELWWGKHDPVHGDFGLSIGEASVAMADDLIAALNAEPNP